METESCEKTREILLEQLTVERENCLRRYITHRIQAGIEESNLRNITQKIASIRAQINLEDNAHMTH